MAITVRESLFSGSNSANCTASIGSGTAVGDVVYVIHMDDFYTAAAMTAPTATGYTFTQRGTTVDMGTNHCHAKVWSATVSTGGAATITCHSTQVDQERYMATFVLTGANEAPDDIGGTGSASAATPMTLTAISPSQTNDLLIVCWECVENTSVGTISSFTSGLTQSGSTTNIANTAFAATATKTLSSSGSTGNQSATPGPSAAEWAGVIIAISPSAAAAAATPPPIVAPNMAAVQAANW